MKLPDEFNIALKKIEVSTDSRYKEKGDLGLFGASKSMIGNKKRC